MKPLHRSYFAGHVLFLCLLIGLMRPAGAQPAASSGIERRYADPAVRVQDDFYRHAVGTWLNDTPMPPDRPRIGTLMSLVDDTRSQMRGLIEEAASKGADDANARRIGNFYASFMDEPRLERLAAEPLAAELARIDALTDKAALGPLFARFVRLQVTGPVAMQVGQDERQSSRYVPTLSQSGLGLPDRDYYLVLEDGKFKEVRQAYAAHLARLLTLAGEADGTGLAAQVLALETGLARVQWTRVEIRDPIKGYNRIDLAGLPALAPQIDWKGMLKALDVEGRTPDVVISQPSYVTGLGQLIETVPLAHWKAYAKVRLLSAYAPFLSRAFVDERFGFANTVLRGTPQNRPRWERGVTLVQDSLAESVGQLYVARHFPPANKAHMERLVGNLLTAYRQSIDGLDWMGPQTRKEAQTKLASMAQKIGYPKRWIDYGRLRVDPGDLVGNVMRAREFEAARGVAKLGRPIDRDEWILTPQTVNAYYNASLNEIVFPAAILQPPFFDARADDAVNYGAIGAVIGHEISHAFDDEGSQYDALGNLRDWWTAEDRARFNAKARQLVEQYGRYEPVRGYPLNGQQTLGENIADNAGLAVAYKAWQLSLGGKASPVIDGMTGEQRFFYGFAQIWRTKFREAFLIEMLKSGVHAPAEFRANGTVRNHPGYYGAFGVQPGDAMYLPPAQRVSFW